MRFGIFVPGLALRPGRHRSRPALGVSRSGQALRRQTTTGESIWVHDHFHTVPVPSEEATHEAWTLMAAFAGVTGRVQLGQMCTCMSYRDPAYLAKVAATVDVVSEGRLEMGIGAGWYEDEWRAWLQLPRRGERLARLREGVEIFRQMWTTGRGTYAGEHYQVDGARCYPRPPGRAHRVGAQRHTDMGRGVASARRCGSRRSMPTT